MKEWKNNVERGARAARAARASRGHSEGSDADSAMYEDNTVEATVDVGPMVTGHGGAGSGAAVGGGMADVGAVFGSGGGNTGSNIGSDADTLTTPLL